MSQAEAVAFIDRVERDEDLAKELESLKENPPAVLHKIRAEGFEVEPEEIRQAFLERYGAELTPEQLEQIAGGVTTAEGVGITVGALVVGTAAAAAAAF
jgi:predicted ribosomally synthesized peptide with nif11-like leader